MTLLSRLRTNPVLGRQLTTGFTGGRLGWSFLLVNGLLFFTYIAILTFFSSAQSGGDKSAAGSFIYFWHHMSLLALFILLLPLKMSGFIEGPRFDRAFDQVVVTGSSPYVFFVGSWITGLLYAAIILLVSLPFAGCMVALTHVRVVDVIVGYGVLLLYSNVIIALSLALSVQVREWAAVPFVIGFLAFVGLLAAIVDGDFGRAYPTFMAELTPVRFFWEKARPWAFMGNQPPWIETLFHGPYFFFAEIPLHVARGFLWSLVVLACGLGIFLGPGHAFQRGLNNFGSVVLPGDRKGRGIWARMRGGLVRRVEVAFFYENASPWSVRWGVPLRFLLGFGFLSFWWGAIVGAAYHGMPLASARTFSDDMVAMLVFVGGGAPLLLWILLSCDTRGSVYGRVAVGRWNPRREMVTTVSFGVLWGSFFILEAILLFAMERNAGGTGSPFPVIDPSNLSMFERQITNFGGLSAQTATNYTNSWWRFVPPLMLIVINLFLFSRFASRASRNIMAVRALTLASVMVIFAGATIVAALVDAGVLPAPFLVFGGFSPYLLDNKIRSLPLTRDDLLLWFLVSHLSLAVFQVVLLMFRYWLRRRSAVLVPVAAMFLIWGGGDLGAQVPPPGEPEAPRSPLVVERVHRGFAGNAFAHGVDFYTAVIRNSGDDYLEGEYWIGKFDGGGERRTFKIGPRSTKILRWHEQGNRMPWYTPDPGSTSVVFSVGGSFVTSPPTELWVQGATSWGNQATAAEQFLLVGGRGHFPQEWVKLALDDDSRYATYCPAEALPLEPGAYQGLELLFIDSRELTRCTVEQRAALFEYLRLGGTIIFSGPLDPQVIAGSGRWERSLGGGETQYATLDGTQLSLGALRESRVAMSRSVPGVIEPVPILQLRSIGAGTVGHLAINPYESKLSIALNGDRAFFKELNEAAPRATFPLLVAGTTFTRIHADVSSMIYLVLFFALYTLGLGFGLILAPRWRKRAQRSKMVWAIVSGSPLVFLIFVPFLIGAIDAHQSVAEYLEVAYFGPGSSEGLVSGQLDLRSAGRQDHSLQCAGRELAAYRATIHPSYFGWYFASEGNLLSSTQPLSLDRKNPRQYGCDLNLLPWSSERVFWFGSAQLPEAPRGSATVTRSTGRCVGEFELPATLRGEVQVVVTHAPSVVKRRAIPSEVVEENDRRVIRFDHVLQLVPPGAAQARANTGNTNAPTFQQLQVFGPRQDRLGVYVVVRPERPVVDALQFDSRDLRLEQEVPEWRRKRVKERAYEFEHPEEWFERDGKVFERLEQRLVIFELRLEVR